MTGLQSFAFCLIWLDEIAASFVAQSDCWLERVERMYKYMFVFCSLPW